MLLKFTKMHGLGNDFMVLDLVRQQAELTPLLIRKLADRKTGVGFDQLLTIARATRPECDFAYRIFNFDGGEVEHCGNGARCVARFVVDQGLTTKTELTFELAKSTIRTSLGEHSMVTVDMGPPILDPLLIPFQASARAITYPLQVAGNDYEICAVSMGNPHAVMIVADTDKARVAELGPLIEYHPRFPERVNAGFMQVLDANAIKLRVFERGVGETLTCGTGACAAVVAGRLRGLLAEEVSVHTHGGTLHIRWNGGEDAVWMTGPTATVFEGQLAL